MEDVLDLYEAPYDPARPVVCFDESPHQLIAEVRERIPATPGHPECFDVEYKRNGVRDQVLAALRQQAERDLERSRQVSGWMPPEPDAAAMGNLGQPIVAPTTSCRPLVFVLKFECQRQLPARRSAGEPQ